MIFCGETAHSAVVMVFVGCVSKTMYIHIYIFFELLPVHNA